jgi:dTMP kinase
MFVVFEGIDGSGKTAVSNQVAAALRARGLPVRHVRADGRYASRVSEAIRDLGRDARHLELVPAAEMLLYVARDVQLIEQLVKPALRDGDIVIADRFLYTAQVLARHGRHLPAAYTDPILSAAAGGIVPDLVVLCDVDPALARARRKSAKLAAADRRPPARKGLAGVGLQHRIRRGYLALAESAPERWAVVDNDAPLEEVVAGVTDLVDAVRGAGLGSALGQFPSRGPRRGQGTSGRVSTPHEALELFLRRVDRYSVRETQRRGVPAWWPGGTRRRRAPAEPGGAGPRRCAGGPFRSGRRRELGDPPIDVRATTARDGPDAGRAGGRQPRGGDARRAGGRGADRGGHVTRRRRRQRSVPAAGATVPDLPEAVVASLAASRRRVPGRCASDGSRGIGKSCRPATRLR